MAGPLSQKSRKRCSRRDERTGRGARGARACCTSVTTGPCTRKAALSARRNRDPQCVFMQAARSPDAGLIGALHLAPSWIFEGHDTVLAVGTAWVTPVSPITAREKAEASYWFDA